MTNNNPISDDSIERMNTQKPQNERRWFSKLCCVKTKSPYFALSILVFCNFLNYLDRYIVFGLMKTLQSYFLLNDKDGGLLQTLFLVFYMIFSVIFGSIGDYFSRRVLISFGLMVWAASTLLGSFVPQNKVFWFYVSRSLVGVGEASLSTLGFAMLGDLFTGSKRTTAISAFFITFPFGCGIGYLIGPIIAVHTGSWRWAFRITPLFGVLAALAIYFLLHDPLEEENAKRGNAAIVVSPESQNLGFFIRFQKFVHKVNSGILGSIRSLGNDLAYLSKRLSYVHATIAYTLTSFVMGCLSIWMPKYITLASENAGSLAAISSEDKVLLMFGIATTVSGLFGVIIGGEISRARSSYSKTSDCETCIFSTLVSLPFVFCSATLPQLNLTLTWVCVVISELLLCFIWTPNSNILFNSTSSKHRAIASGFQIFVMHAFGDAISPVIVGSISDSVRSKMFGFDPILEASSYAQLVSLSCSFLIMPLILFLAVVFYMLSEHYYVRDVMAVEKEHLESQLRLIPELQDGSVA